jgi:hypothetical protein
MNIYNPPTAIHGKAIDLACESDRVWFDENPRVEWLRAVRPLRSSEFGHRLLVPAAAPPIEHYHVPAPHPVNGRSVRRS